MIATSPVRAISISPWGRTMRSKLEILSWVPVTSIVIVLRDTSTMLARKISANCMISARLSTGAETRNSAISRETVLSGLHVADLDHVDELVKLLRHLVDRVDRAVDRERHARDLWVLGRADGERVDVEPAPAEEPGDAREHARLVLDEEREDVLAAGQPAS